jgi:hypothetical protein
LGVENMKRGTRERIVTAVAILLFFAAFTTVAILDRSHGNNGSGIGVNDVGVDVNRNDGHLTIPQIPDSLLVLPAGKNASVDFSIVNNDRDNDIDTIVVEVPGSVVNNGSSTWYDPNFLDHQWNLNVSDDTATFEARDDWFGRVFGGSAQYDVVGNLDDALDHFEQNETISISVSEGITLTVDFTTPSSSGIKKGNEGMQVSVGDLKTEETSSSLTALYPDGYPYLVIEDGYEVVVIDIDSENVSLEVQYGGKTLFSGSTRSVSNYKQASEGISYQEDGHTYAILEAPPEGEVIKPIIKGDDNITGEVNVVFQQILVKDIEADGEDLLEVVKTNSTSVPVPPPGQTYVDTDGDWIFDIDDPDDDNDNIPDGRDPEPKIPGTVWVNEDPEITLVLGPQERIFIGDEFTLEVYAEDLDDDPMTFIWTVSGSNWTEEGEAVNGPVDLEPGTYTFTITVSDNKGGQEVRTLDVVIEKKDDGGGGLNPIVIIAVVALVLIVIVVVIFMVRRGGGEEEEDEEIPDDVDMEYEEPPVEEDLLIDEPVDEAFMEEEEEIEEDEMEEETGDIPPPIAEGIDEIEVEEKVIGDTCPHCNHPLVPTDTRCSNCGTEFDIELECPICGAKVDQTMDTCPSCGVSFLCIGSVGPHARRRGPLSSRSSVRM